jgi:hypothetical protein
MYPSVILPGESICVWVDHLINLARQIQAMGAMGLGTSSVKRLRQINYVLTCFLKNNPAIQDNQVFRTWHVSTNQRHHLSRQTQLPDKNLRERHRHRQTFKNSEIFDFEVSKRPWPFPETHSTIRTIVYTKFNENSAQT